MKKILLVLVFFFIISTSNSQNNLPVIISNSEKAVFIVQAYDNNGELLKFGTGFFIDENGTCITNYHVFENSSIIKIVTINNLSYPIKEIIKSSRNHDLIVFTIEVENKVDFLKINKTIPLKGESVITIGNPIGLNWSVSEGIISGIRETTLGNILQITAPISHGNSGGPLLNKNGEVIGIATFNIADGQNLNFALHIGILDSIYSNDLLFESIGKNAKIPDDIEIAKSYLDSLIWIYDTELEENRISNSSILNHIENYIIKYPKSAHGYYAKAKFYNFINPTKAFDFFSRAIDTEPQNPLYYMFRAAFLIYESPLYMVDSLNKKMQMAINDSKIYGSFSIQKLTYSYKLIARCYVVLDEKEKAIEYYSKYIDDIISSGKYPNDLSTTYISRAHLYWDKNDFEKANIDYDKAISLNPICNNYLWKVEFLIDYEKYNEASKILLDECITDHDYINFYNKSLILLKINGDLNKARHYIKKAISIIEEGNFVWEFEKYYRLSAIINESNGDHVETLKDLNKLIEINPSLKSDFEICTWIIEKKFELDDYIGALNNVNSLIEKFPERPYLFETKGLILSRLNDDIGAIKSYSRAIEINNSDGRLYRLRGLSKYYSGDKIGACSDWSKAGELGEYKAYEHIKNYCN